MYLVSGLVNNLTALLLVLPVLLILLKLMGVGQRQLSWTLGVILIACNLGGAATPIGDFPAILLLGRGSMSFSGYLVRAAPPTALALFVLLALVIWLVRPQRGAPQNPLAERLSVAVMQKLYRSVRLDTKLLVPALSLLFSMLLAWMFIPASTGITPEIICWIGVRASTSKPRCSCWGFF
jgi:Na+/H+ antiporter NhaD/arsenite permease-like protein